jgi:hypothetical protein
MRDLGLEATTERTSSARSGTDQGDNPYATFLTGITRKDALMETFNKTVGAQQKKNVLNEATLLAQFTSELLLMSCLHDFGSLCYESYPVSAEDIKVYMASTFFFNLWCDPEARTTIIKLNTQ